MNCPVCNASLSPHSCGGETIDVCSQCHGVWFDAKELGPVITAVANQEEIPDLPAKEALHVTPPKAPEDEPEKLCPKCHIPTRLLNYSYDSNIFLNSCPDCKGLWADSGELRKMAQYSKGNQKIKAIAQELGRQQHQKRRFLNLLTSRKLSGGVAILYLIGAALTGEPKLIYNIAMFLILPLACIWFSEAMGGFTGRIMLSFRPAISQTSPALLVAAMGWLLLLSPLAMTLLVILQ